MPTAGMLAHLTQNVTFLTDVWKMTSADNLVAAYTGCSRKIVFETVTYKPSFAAQSDPTRVLGLEPDSGQLSASLGDIVTEADVQAGRWRAAAITREFVNWADLTMGSVCKQVGVAGEIEIRGGMFTVQFNSLASRLHQEIGDLTSPTDRRRRLDQLGISIVPYTHAATVQTVTDRRRFTVNVAQADGYFRYGLAKFTSGANNNLEMEIKNNVGVAIELQLPMRSNIVIGDTLNLIRGYDGTRAAAKALGAAVVESMEAEPDLPGLSGLLAYPD